jgi:competence protein ComEA
MSKLRIAAVVFAFLGLSVSAFAADDQKAPDQTVTTATSTTTTDATATTTAAVEEKANLNTADVDTLAKVKGIGKKKAEEIVDFRTKNGNFKAVEDLLNVKGKGMNDKWLEKVKDKVTV